jgi:alpha(1,3/1,4) fucosyltransferase
MRNIALITKNYLNNECFNESIFQNPVDDKFLKFRSIKKMLRQIGLNIETYDVLLARGEEVHAFLVKDYISWNWSEKDKPSILIAMESEVIEPELYEVEYLRKFNSVLSWKDLRSLVNHFEFFNYNFDIRENFYKNDQYVDQENERIYKVVCVQSFFPYGYSRHSYLERQNLIFEAAKYLGNDFKLFGKGWDQLDLNNAILNKIANRLPAVRKAVLKHRHFYMGPVESKYAVLKRAIFALAVENYCTPGYITEKFFDCFLAGTIPIYIGSASIKDYVNEDSYIFVGDFDNLTHALEHALSLTNEEQSYMLISARRWMESNPRTFDLYTENAKIVREFTRVLDE